jgi:cellulose synthase/poly-beta-1,6-N-acetylglucosamine synthase-like glycosyltransferase
MPFDIYLYGKKRKKGIKNFIAKGRLKMEKVSIGICAYNEKNNIAQLLDNLLTGQTLSLDSEIIVLCSGCTDKTPEIVREFHERDKRVKLIIEQERKGKSSAVNIILSNYSAKYLFSIPADVIPAPLALSRLLNKMLSDPKIGVVGGRPIPVNLEKGFSGYLSHLMWRLHHRTLQYFEDRNLDMHASGEMLVMRRGMVSEIPEDVVNDDAYIAVEASYKGFSVRYCKDAVVYIKAPTSVADFIRQRRRVVYGHSRVKQLTNQNPQTLEGMAFRSPGRVIHILTDEIKERPGDIPKLFMAISIEAVVNFLARMDILRKKNHTVWKIAESTKSLIEEESENEKILV